jgi:hypothetical protein
MPSNNWSWPVTWWKLITTDCPTAWATRRATKCGSVTQPAWRGNCPSSSPQVVTWINDVIYRIQQNTRLSMMVVHLDQFVPYQGTIRDKWPKRGSSGRSWKVIISWTKPQRKKVRPITCHRHVPSERKKWQYASRLVVTNSRKEGAM